MRKLKIVVFITGLLPVSWYVYQIQGKYMNEPKKIVLDDIRSAADALGIFPRTCSDMEYLVEKIKHLSLERIATIKVIPAAERTFENTAKAQDVLGDDVNKVMNLIELCNMVYPEAELRACAEKLTVSLSAFIIDKLSLNKDLYHAFIEYAQGNGLTESLNAEQTFYVAETLKDFKNSGFELPEEKQLELKKLQKELSELTLAFDANIAKDVRSISVSADALKGLTDEQMAAYYDASKDAFVLKTDYPTVDLVLQNCSIESTRKALWKEFNNRAYPENSDILKKVIAVRHQIAQLLGYESYAHYNLDDSMAESPEKATTFLDAIKKRSEIKIEQEFKEITQKIPEGVTLTAQGKINPWDFRYIMNFYKKMHASLDERLIAEYFPLEKTISILLTLYEEFLGLTFEPVAIEQLSSADRLWHPDVRLIKALQGDKLLGYLFLDLHPRDHKYTHACHGSIIHGIKDQHGKQIVPAVSLVIANFPKSLGGDKPALLMRNDVNTFFHEFGHAVHALCGATQMAAFSGTKTKRDFVELPSQMLEEWLWQPDVLKRISCHYKTQESLNNELIDAIIGIKNIDTGFAIRRQLTFAYLSLACFNSSIEDDMKKEYQNLFNELTCQQEYCPEENFIASFGHLMGYGAQYYGYLWSKVFALDLFDYIKQHGLSKEIGARYRDIVIGKGGSRHPSELLQDFLGREPNSDAFFNDMKI